MNVPLLIPVVSQLNSQVSDDTRNHPIQLSQRTLSQLPSIALRLAEGEQLAAEPISSIRSVAMLLNGDSSIVGFLYQKANAGTASWMIFACTSRLGINGQTPLLPVAAIELGDVLMIGQRGWMFSSLWRPEAVDAPHELRNKPCPMCGAELAVAPVVQCVCGRWSHLENMQNVEDKNALNCFLKAGQCSDCGRRASLDAQITPEVPDSLVGAATDCD